MTLGEIAAVVGGTVHDGHPDLLVTAPVEFHSGAVPSGGMFVALAGERVDGHDFAAAAIAGGAAAVLAARPVGVPAVIVDDVAAAYARLASEVAARLPAMSVVAVTGSVGKTTTKDFLGQVLSAFGATIAPAGNRNNELGVPHTVLQATASTRFLVLEMGARHSGDIAYLAGLVRPHVAIVLNVGAAHLGEFGSIDAIAAAKGELVEALPADGVAVLNADDARVAAMRTRTAARLVTFGRQAHATVQARDVTIDAAGQASFTLRTPSGSAPVRLHLPGEHQVSNALAVAAAALQFNRRRRARRPRTQRRTTGVAGPDGRHRPARRRADHQRRVQRQPAVHGRRPGHPGRDDAARSVAVLRRMNELGATSAEEHAALGRAVAAATVAWLVVVGDGDAQVLADTARSHGTTVTQVPDADTAYRLLRAGLVSGDVVLVKASHSIGLMTVAARLAACH